MASCYHIRGLRHIRAALSKNTACTVASAIVGSRLDYCNALLVGISESDLDKLQRVQNTLARVVTGTHRRDHISPVLVDLHWLPIRTRITYRIATLVFKIHEVKQPMYLAELIEDYKPVRELRSTSRIISQYASCAQHRGLYASARAALNIEDYKPVCELRTTSRIISQYASCAQHRGL